LSVTCNRSVVFSGLSGFLHQQNWLPRNNWILLKVVLNTMNLPIFYILFFRHSVDLFLDFINVFRKLMIILAKKVCTLMCTVYITVIMSIVSNDAMVRVLTSGMYTYVYCVYNCNYVYSQRSWLECSRQVCTLMSTVYITVIMSIVRGHG